MALSFREQSLRRKFIYTGIIVVLFFLMIFHRRLVLEDRAEKHDLKEIHLGEVDMGGSAARFALVSFRGPLICGLWWEAQERKDMHDWAQMELLTRSLTKLQPHFQGPWLYLAWDWAYNVAVEFDDIEKKYFYFTLGTQLLAEGEMRNRAQVYNAERGTKEERGDPDMRWNLGFYIQQKLTVSDETPYFRAFMQLSCIPPDEWDPVKLGNDPQKLETFKRDYPRLAQRVREMRRIPERAENQLNQELLTFLKAHRGLPSLYPPDLAGVPPNSVEAQLKKFPIWPPTSQYTPANPASEPEQDAFEIAHRWYAYSVEPLPPPRRDLGLFDLASRTRREYRTPTQMNILIFRGYPAKAKGMRADQLAKEGWFKDSQTSWDEMHQLWLKFGSETGLEPDADEIAMLQRRAERLRQAYPQAAQQGDQMVMFRDPEMRANYEAFLTLQRLDRSREVTRYLHWKLVSETNRRDEAVAARQHIYNATNRRRADLRLAQTEFEKGIDIFRDLLLVPPRQQARLLALGAIPASGIESVAVGTLLGAHPQEMYAHTDFGRDWQMQEETLESLVPYQRLRAKRESPSWMKPGFIVWDAGQIAQFLGHQVSFPGQQVVALGHIPVGPRLVTIHMVQGILEERPGPLDAYVSPNVLQMVRGRMLPSLPQPGPGVPEGSIPRPPDGSGPRGEGSGPKKP